MDLFNQIPDTIKQDAFRRMLAARERVARRTPFFASLIFNARLVESDRRAAIWTNGVNFFYNPHYVTAQENDPFIEGNFLKAVLKCALQHFSRRKYRDWDKWCSASELSVGPVVHQYFPEQPGLCAGDGLYPNKAVEEIYDLIPDSPTEIDLPVPSKGEGEGEEGKGGNQGEGEDEGEGQGGGSDQGEGEDQSNSGGGDNADQPGGMEQPSPEDEAAAEQAARDWKHALENAKDKAQKAGNMPANVLRLVEELLPEQKLDYRDLIREMAFDAKSMQGRTWSRLNRRRREPVMPGYPDDAIYQLVACFDVSGSIDTDTQFAAMKTTIAGMIEQKIITQAVLIAVDTCPKLNEIVVANTVEDVRNWHPHGGGGTNFESALDYVIKHYPHSIGMVFLTDMETNSFGRKPPFPGVWVNFGYNKKLKAPWGRTCDYDVTD